MKWKKGHLLISKISSDENTYIMLNDEDFYKNIVILNQKYPDGTFYKRTIPREFLHKNYINVNITRNNKISEILDL